MTGRRKRAKDMALGGLRRKTRSTLLWVLSLVFFLSANGQALAFLVCRDANCPMFAALESAPKSCCEGEEESSEKSCDCCELSALPQMDKGPVVAALQVAELELAVLSEPVRRPAKSGETQSVEQSLFRSDHSPPAPTHSPDLGRAPPAS